MKALQTFAIFSLIMLCNSVVADNHQAAESETDLSTETTPTDNETSSPDEEYKKVFKIDFEKSCLDGDQSDLARELCDCMSDELIRSNSVAELIDITEYDEKLVMLSCLQRAAP